VYQGVCVELMFVSHQRCDTVVPREHHPSVYAGHRHLQAPASRPKASERETEVELVRPGHHCYRLPFLYASLLLRAWVMGCRFRFGRSEAKVYGCPNHRGNEACSFMRNLFLERQPRFSSFEFSFIPVLLPVCETRRGVQTIFLGIVVCSRHL